MTFVEIEVAGVDTALFEETILDEKTGRMLNGNMADYKWRTFADLPDFKNVILEIPIQVTGLKPSVWVKSQPHPAPVRFSWPYITPSATGSCAAGRARENACHRFLSSIGS